MSLKDDKRRVSIVFPLDLKADLERIAEQENRAMSNLVVTVLKDFVVKYDRQKDGEKEQGT